MTLPDSLVRKKERLDALRPLAVDSLSVLDRWFDVELTFTSNAIEGSTLTRSETAIVVEKGITIGGKPLRDHLEAIDHMEALAFVRALAAAAEPLRETDIRGIHRLVMARTQPEEAGAYARHQRRVLGSRVRFPTPAEIPHLMAEFAAWLAGATSAPETAFEAHYRLVTIHPFADGNGRTSRLIMNLGLLRAGYPPITIGPPERAAYLGALELRQLGGDAGPWADLMTARLDAALDTSLDHLDPDGGDRLRSKGAPS